MANNESQLKKEKKRSNAVLFRKLMQERRINKVKFEQGVAGYVLSKEIPSAHQRLIAAHNLRKELARDSMSDKLLAKGLKVIGMSDEEVGKILLDRA